MKKIIRVFPRRTSFTPRDAFAFVGDPPMFRPEAEEVHVSCTFTWDKIQAKRLARAWAQYYPIVKVGGPAMGVGINGFTPGMYVRHGITFTTRGCNNHCPYCLVHEREGRLHEYEDFAVGNNVADNNVLQASRAHRDRVFAMLKTQYMVRFSGGLDSHLVTDDVADQVRSLRIDEVFLACDYPEALKPLKKAIHKLQLGKEKTRCFVLLAFNGETIDQAQQRLLDVWYAGAMPFAQLYQPPDQWIDYSSAWIKLCNTWSRPAKMKAEVRRLEGREE